MAVAFRRTGTGPGFLLLHGIGSSSASFQAQFDGLKDEFTLVAWDAPGYADSDDPDQRPGIDGYVDEAADLLEKELGPSHVVGVSWGGVIALRLAAIRPDLVRSLTVIGASLGSGVDPERATQMRERARDLDRLGNDAFASERAPRLLSPDAPAALKAEVVATMAASLRQPGYRAAADAMAGADLTHDATRITAPTLVLAGEQDTVTGPERAREIAASVPGAALVTVPGAGHLVNQEQPELVNAWLRGFARVADHLETPAPTEGTLMTLQYDDAYLAAFTDSIILTKETRHEDWDTLGFQAKAGDQFKRAQIRYVGSGATGNHENDQRTIASKGFTFSNMLLPPGGEGPEHTHHDAEEAFFVLEGEVEVGIHRDGQVEKRTLGYRDMIVVPAGVPRSLKNNGDKDALFCVIIGAQKPQVPTYPETSAMHGVTRD